MINIDKEKFVELIDNCECVQIISYNNVLCYPTYYVDIDLNDVLILVWSDLLDNKTHKIFINMDESKFYLDEESSKITIDAVGVQACEHCEEYFQYEDKIELALLYKVCIR